MSTEQIKELATEVVLDREQVFLLFCTFSGNIEETAHASGLRAVDVLKMVEQEGWLERLKPILELQKSQRPGDYARGMNRALNYVQARRLWLFLERVVGQVCNMTPAEVHDYIFTSTPDKNGVEMKKMSTRALTDLAAAVEKCQALTYQALSDTATDRGRRQEQAGGSDDANAGELHLRIAAAMSKVKQSSTPRALLFDAQVAQAQSIVKEATKPANPYDGDS